MSFVLQPNSKEYPIPKICTLEKLWRSFK